MSTYVEGFNLFVFLPFTRIPGIKDLAQKWAPLREFALSAGVGFGPKGVMLGGQLSLDLQIADDFVFNDIDLHLRAGHPNTMSQPDSCDCVLDGWHHVCCAF